MCKLITDIATMQPVGKPTGKLKLELTFAAQLRDADLLPFCSQCWLPYERARLLNPKSVPRADFAWHEEKVAVEVQGGTWSAGGHTRGKQYAADCVKLNNAQLDGWLVLWFDTDQVSRSDYALKTTLEALEIRRK